MLELIETVPWRANDYPITVAELKSASKDLQRLLSAEQIDSLVDFLAFNPEGGEIIPGTGRIRKTRWPYKNKGKSKGLRVLYYFHDLNMPLYILAVYSKGETLRLTKREELGMRKLVKILVHEHATRTAEMIKAQGNSA